jgi:hypothetical protein
VPHEYLSDEQVSRYGRFVTDPTAEELEKFFFLDGVNRFGPIARNSYTWPAAAGGMYQRQSARL